MTILSAIGDIAASSAKAGRRAGLAPKSIPPVKPIAPGHHQSQGTRSKPLIAIRYNHTGATLKPWLFASAKGYPRHRPQVTGRHLACPSAVSLTAKPNPNKSLVFSSVYPTRVKSRLGSRICQ
jgi:hypothetical protein